MDTKKNIKRLFGTGNVYVWMIGLLGAVSLFFDLRIGIGELILFVVLLIFNYVHNKRKVDMVNELVDNIALDADTASKSSLTHFPMPTVMLQLNGRITWYNAKFREIFDETKSKFLFDVPLESLVEGLKLDEIIDLENKVIDSTIVYNGRTFHIIGNVSQLNNASKRPDSEWNYIITLYWQEMTDYVRIKERFYNERVFVTNLLVDNYDDLMQNTKEASKPQLIAEMDRHINEWANKYDGLLYKYERDKYLILFEYVKLEAIIKDKFDILNTMRAMDLDNKIPVTVSIGIGVDGKNMVENDSCAREAVNMALGRGGDQAVIKDDSQFRFYGGGSKEYEKSTRVKARVVAFALKGLIDNADNVVIMGHKTADIDSFGAAFGLQRACRQLNKEAKILLGSYDNTVHNMLERLENEEEYIGMFISNQQAEELVKENTLLIVVDTHKPSLTENANILTKTKHIVIIDHHRRSADFIENTALVYHEPYASSACEMVTEILQYISDKIELKKLEAEALYAGIAIDTKHFTFKTGVRTFEAASFLRKYGVDTVAIKTMFQQDLTTFVRKAEIIKNAKIIRDHIAISTYAVTEGEYQVLVAQAADEMLNIKGITASFVLCDTGSSVSISGRSLGSINVQVILEKLGGGGHLTIAGAQINEISLSDAQQQLLDAIEEYFNESAA